MLQFIAACESNIYAKRQCLLPASPTFVQTFQCLLYGNPSVVHNAKLSASSTERLSLSLSLTFLRQQTSHSKSVNIINAMMNSVQQRVQHSLDEHVDNITAVIYSVQQRVELLRCGLGERVASVKKQASLMLRTWLDDTCRSDVVKLLEYLDVHSYKGLCICWFFKLSVACTAIWYVSPF